MANEAGSYDRGRLTPAGTLALLLEEAEEAHEISTRADVMAERKTGEEIPKRFMIGLVTRPLPISELRHPVFEKILIGIRGRLTANSCDLLLCATRALGADEDLRRNTAEQTIERGVDALIAWGIADNDPECAPILAAGLPTMFVDNEVFAKRTGSVLSTNVEGMIQVVRHLYDSGHRRIAHISGHFDTRVGPDRLFGYKSELGRLGLPSVPEYVEEGDFFVVSGYEAAKRLLALPEPPDAIACASDAMAISAMAAIEEAGLRIPEDIAVTGFDDADFAVTVRPALTTVRQDAIGMGTAAAEAILRMLEDPEIAPPVVIIPTELVIRESSDVAKLALQSPP